MKYRIFANTILFTACIFFEALFADVIINELQPAPKGAEPEWVELYNKSDNSIALDSFLFSDATATRRLPSFSIPPKGFAILTKDTLALLTSRKVPLSSKMVQFNLPTLNNTKDECVIRRKDSSSVDSVYYDVKWGEAGKSFERIDPTMPAVSRSNLGKCVAIDGATPGAVNSIALLDYDLAMASISAFGDTLQLIIANYGAKTATNGSVSIVAEKRTLSPEHSFSQILSLDLPDMKPGEEREIIAPYRVVVEKTGGVGLHLVKAIALLPLDMRRYNDTAEIEFLIEKKDIDEGLTISPNPFQPTGSKSELCEIFYKTPYSNANATAKIYDPNGHIIRHISRGFTAGKTGVLYWDGKNDNGYNVQLGPYILVFSAADRLSGEVFTAKAMIVIGG